MTFLPPNQQRQSTEGNYSMWLHIRCVLFLTAPHTHPFNGPLSGTTWWASTRKVKPIWTSLKQETVSGSGISWAICKSAPHSRQITMPAPHNSVFTGPLSGTTQWASTRKVKPIWTSLKQETVSGSGISWAICKSAPHSRQITMPAPHNSVFTGRMPFLLPNQQRQSTEGTNSQLHQNI